MRVPKYREKPGRDFAYVEWRGVRHKLPGAYNSPESQEAYRAFLARYVFGDKQQREEPTLTLSGLILRYLDFAKEYYPVGTRGTGEFDNLRPSLIWLAEHCGHLLAHEFSPQILKQVQQRLTTEKRRPGRNGKQTDITLSRTYINARLNRIRRMFRWAATEGLVPADLPHTLESVAPLKCGLTRARETAGLGAVDEFDFYNTLAFCEPQIADMLSVMWYTGLRADSVCRARLDQFYIDCDPWIWQPRHKTERKRGTIDIPIGPRCRRVLEKYLLASDGGYLFQPTRARNHALYRAHYDSRSLLQHVTRAIDKARAVGLEIPRWSLHMIRHAHEQRVERQYGMDTARAALAHTSLDATKLYSARDYEAARRVAMEMG